jgi:cytochrome c553
MQVLRVRSRGMAGEPVAQLEAFAGGARRNDISGQMRNIARHLTAEEIAAIGADYGETAAE